MDSLPIVCCAWDSIWNLQVSYCVQLASYVQSYAVEYLQIVMVFILEILSQII